MPTVALHVDIPVGALPQAVMRIKIRKARLVAELSQAELGQAIGTHLNQPPITFQTVYRWEKTGEVPGYYLGAIAAATGVAFEFFKV